MVLAPHEPPAGIFGREGPPSRTGAGLRPRPSSPLRPCSSSSWGDPQPSLGRGWEFVQRNIIGSRKGVSQEMKASLTTGVNPGKLQVVNGDTTSP